jgi:HAD superfamily hydrolase (TIGR01509 family)
MRLPRPVRGVLFDMDGLLVDSESVWRDALQAAAEALGSPLPTAIADSLIGLPWPQTEAKLQSFFGADFDVPGYIDRTARLAEALKGQGVALKAGVIELLDLLDGLALPRAIVTSSNHATVKSHLGPHGLLGRFDAVLAHGDYERGKPAPDPYLRGAERIGQNPAACLALEDSHNGVRAAHAAGMMTVMIPDLLAPTAEMHDLCVGVLDTLHAVRDAIQAANG